MMHVRSKWTPQPGGNDGIGATEWHSIVKRSTFTLCPRGHNAETFRLYEAIAVGSIPVLARSDYSNVKDSACAAKEYFEGIPALHLPEWSIQRLGRTMITLAANHTYLNEMTLRMREWYERTLIDALRGIAHVRLVTQPPPYETLH